MSITEFLSKLRRLKVKVQANGHQLEIQAPPDILTPDLRNELAERKSEILHFLHRSAQATSPEMTIVPRPPEEEPTLSFAQQRMWFLSQVEPESSVYNIPLSFSLKGKLDILSLEKSIQMIVQRHEVLRAQFPGKNGLPSQKISESVPRLALHDLRHLSESDRQATVRTMIEEEGLRPFDLVHGPVLRTILLQLSEQEYVFLLVMHHIVSDGWSLGIFCRELASCYEALSLNQPISLPRLPFQYADFAKWQKEWLKDETLEQQLEYWREQLANLPSVQLPTDYARSVGSASMGKLCEISIDKGLTDELYSLSYKEGTTLAITLLAAFQVLLARYTGEVDISVGSPIANRNHPEIEGLIGLFVNSLVMRTDLSGDPSFREVLARVQQVSLKAYEHQDLPFEKLVEVLQPDRDLNQNPLFQVLFAVQNIPYDGMTLPGLMVSPYANHMVTTSFDLECHVWENPQGLTLSLVYDTNLFEENTIARLGMHFQSLLGALVENPEKRIGSVSLIGKEEYEKILVTSREGKITFPHKGCIHELFERQVRQNPEAVALVWGNHEFTFDELNRRANQLGHYLKSIGVGPEVRVGLCLDRSPDLIIGLLGILKAGGAYVPIDPEFPRDRIQYLVQESGITALITLKKIVPLFPDTLPTLICLDSDRCVYQQEPDTNVNVAMTNQNLAYVIFTSGSTGAPKGVMIQHSTLVNFIQGAVREYGIQPEDRMLQFASISFDASVEEVFCPLVGGATMVLRSDSMTDSIDHFLQECQEFEISVLDIPTAFWHSVVAHLGEEGTTLPSSIRRIIIGGERAIPEKLQEWRRVMGHTIPLFNTYGPTETTVAGTLVDVSKDDGLQPLVKEVPIGQSYPNVQCLVLDECGQPLPIGMVGELFIGGAGVARGYSSRPDLTAAKFVPNPYDEEPGSRMYATGDRARFLPDGNLEFRGRVDRQVKIRGYRVELGEIEETLRQHQEIQDAVVVCLEGSANGHYLVGYVKPGPGINGAPGIIDGWRNFLREKLPHYMVPHALIMMESFPMTVQGKLDHRALPEPDRKDAGLDEVIGLPRNPIEEALIRIWQEVLKTDRVSIYDNFFELGGHSLLATQIVLRVSQQFQIQLPLRDIFNHPSLAELAQTIEVRMTEDILAMSSGEVADLIEKGG